MEGFVLRTIDYQEHAKLLYVYTESGIKSMIARGVKKMNSPLRHLAQSGNLITLELSTGKLPTLKDARLINHYPETKKDLIKTTVVATISELVTYNVADEDNHTKLFAFLKKVFHTIETTGYPDELLMVFELKFFHFLGYGLNLKDCHVCQTQANLAFDVNIGALVCTDHQQRHHSHIGPESYRYMQYYYYLDITAFTPQKLDMETRIRLFDTIDSLTSMHMGVKPKAKQILRTLITGGNA